MHRYQVTPRWSYLNCLPAANYLCLLLASQALGQRHVGDRGSWERLWEVCALGGDKPALLLRSAPR